MWWSVSRARQETWIRSLQPPRRWSPGISVWSITIGWVRGGSVWGQWPEDMLRRVGRVSRVISWLWLLTLSRIPHQGLYYVNCDSFMILHSQTHWRINRMSSSWWIIKHWIFFAEIMNHDLSGCDGDLLESAAVPAPQSSHCAVPHWDK